MLKAFMKCQLRHKEVYERICVVIPVRPSFSRVKSVLGAVKVRSCLKLQPVVAGSALLSRYENSVDFIEADSFKIDEEVFMVSEGDNPLLISC